MHAADLREHTLAPSRHPRAESSAPASDRGSGPMLLTTSLIKGKSPCVDGFRWYLRHHADGTDYQDVLDSLVAAGRVDDACWLLDQIGPTSAVLEVDAVAADHLVFAGTVVARRDIETGSLLRAGRAIHSGGGIRAGAIVAGTDIRSAAGIRSDGALEAGGDIDAGWSIEAAGHVRCGGKLRSRADVTCAGSLDAGCAVVAGGDLLVEGSVQCGGSMSAGGLLRSGADIRVALGLLGRARIECGRHLEAGWGIKAAEAIVAQGCIRAGESLCAEDEIRAGCGYGVFAGLSVPRDAWECSARVSARTKPAQLLSGWWVEPSTPGNASRA